MLASLYKARADTLPGEAKQRTIFGVIVTFEHDIASEKRP